jgi:hypothetical protein
VDEYNEELKKVQEELKEYGILAYEATGTTDAADCRKSSASSRGEQSSWNASTAELALGDPNQSKVRSTAHTTEFALTST